MMFISFLIDFCNEIELISLHLCRLELIGGHVLLVLRSKWGEGAETVMLWAPAVLSKFVCIFLDDFLGYLSLVIIRVFVVMYI